MGCDILTQTFGIFTSYVLKYNTLVVGKRFRPHLPLSLLQKHKLNVYHSEVFEV